MQLLSFCAARSSEKQQERHADVAHLVRRRESGVAMDEERPTKPGSRWLVYCACGWTFRTASFREAQDAVVSHESAASSDEKHVAEIQGD